MGMRDDTTSEREMDQAMNQCFLVKIAAFVIMYVIMCVSWKYQLFSSVLRLLGTVQISVSSAYALKSEPNQLFLFDISLFYSV